MLKANSTVVRHPAQAETTRETLTFKLVGNRDAAYGVHPHGWTARLHCRPAPVASVCPPPLPRLIMQMALLFYDESVRPVVVNPGTFSTTK